MAKIKGSYTMAMREMIMEKRARLICYKCNANNSVRAKRCRRCGSKELRLKALIPRG